MHALGPIGDIEAPQWCARIHYRAVAVAAATPVAVPPGVPVAGVPVTVPPGVAVAVPAAVAVPVAVAEAAGVTDGHSLVTTVSAAACSRAVGSWLRAPAGTLGSTWYAAQS